MTAELRSERRDATLVLSLSDPAGGNALSAAMCAAGVEALNVAETDPGLHCVLLRGEGLQFCTGVADDAVDGLYAFVEALRAFPRPVVASVEGAAVGGGLALALACDLVVAARDARFTMAGPSGSGRGDGADRAAIWSLLQALPRHRVTQALWLGRGFEAAELEAVGILQTAVAPGEAFDAALALCARLSMRQNGTWLADGKEALQHWPPQPLAYRRRR